MYYIGERVFVVSGQHAGLVGPVVSSDTNHKPVSYKIKAADYLNVVVTEDEIAPHHYGEESLSDSDYYMKEQRIWLTVKNLSVRIAEQSEGLDIKVYKVGEEDLNPIAEFQTSFE